MPLIDRVVRDAIETYLPLAPWLDSRPLYALVEIHGLAWGKMIDIPRGTAATTRVDAHADVAIGHPLLRIDNFPALVFVRRARRNVRVLHGHSFPLVRITVLEGKPFGVGAVAQNSRVFSVGNRPKDIGAQDEAVIHRNWHVPVNAHAVPYFRAMLHPSSSCAFNRS